MIRNSYGLEGAGNLIPGNQRGAAVSLGLIKPGCDVAKEQRADSGPFLNIGGWHPCLESSRNQSEMLRHERRRVILCTGLSQTR